MGEEETTNISHPTLASECPFMKSPFGAKYFLGIPPPPSCFLLSLPSCSCTLYPSVATPVTHGCRGATGLVISPCSRAARWRFNDLTTSSFRSYFACHNDVLLVDDTLVLNRLLLSFTGRQLGAFALRLMMPEERRRVEVGGFRAGWGG